MAIKITVAQRRKLAENAKILASAPRTDLMPVLKLFHPVGAANWLLISMAEGQEDTADCISDLGHGFVERGLVDMVELRTMPKIMGLSVEVDRWWTPKARVSAYLADGQATGRLNCDLE